MKESLFHELLGFFLGGKISEDDQARLETEVASNPERRKVYEQYRRMQKASAVLARDFAQAEIRKNILGNSAMSLTALRRETDYASALRLYNGLLNNRDARIAQLLYEEIYPLIRGMCKGYLGKYARSDADIDDISRRAWERLIRKGPQHDLDNRRFEAWIRTAALRSVNEHIKVTKRSDRANVAIDDVPESHGASVDIAHSSESMMDIDELAKAVESAISKLSKREQIILRLRYTGDKTAADIAKELSISETQVRRLWYTALSRLRKLMMPPFKIS